MIDLKERPEVGWDVLLAVSVIGILVACWFIFLHPAVQPAPALSPEATLQDLRASTQANSLRSAVARRRIRERTWDIGSEIFGSQILESLTTLADKNHVQLSGFRNLKTILAADLVEAPVVITLEGGFMDVMAFANSLEQPGSRIALGQIQIAGGTGTDHVTATLSLTGFLYREAK